MLHERYQHEMHVYYNITHPTFILALSARFLGRTMLYLASSEGGGLTARDQALPPRPPPPPPPLGKPGVMEDAEAPKLLRMLPLWPLWWWKPLPPLWWIPLPFPLRYGLWLPLPRKVP